MTHERPASGSNGAVGPPTRLLLKLSNSQRHSAHHGLGNGKEVWFCRHIAPAPGLVRVPLARCVVAAHEVPHGASHFVR